MNRIKKRIFEIIERSDNKSDALSVVYDVFMLIIIALSILPLTFATNYPLFNYIEAFTISIFILDYILRWITADLKLGKKGWSFILYPITPMAIIDLLSILPGITVLNSSFKLLRVTRLFKILRLFKFLRYSNKLEILWRVLKKERGVLLSVLGIAVFYVFMTALIMFNVEPHINPETGIATFEDFFDALYWATVTLTTVGYGDLCPVTDLGRFISMLSSLFGVAIIALPSGVITASYLNELKQLKSDKEES